MTQPSITVAFYTHNRPEFLSVAIGSVLQQTIPAQEILIVDDGSGPATRSAIEALQAQHPGMIRYIWQEQQGRPAARNKIIKESRGSHILWIGDDDALLPTTIETHLAILATKPDTEIIYGRVVNCDEKLNPINRMDSHRLDGPDRLYLFFKHNPVPDPGTLISKSCYERVGLYGSRFARAQDYDFYARAASANASFEFNDSDVCLYRSHSGNQATSEQLKKGAQYRRWVVEDFISHHTLEEIFPHHPWASHPEDAFYESILEMAGLFSRIGGHDTAIEALESVTLPQFQTQISFAKRLVSAAKDSGTDGIAQLKAEPLFNEPKMRRLRELLIVFLLTPEEIHAFNQSLLTQGTTAVSPTKDSQSQMQSEDSLLISMSRPLFEEAAGILAGTTAIRSDHGRDVEVHPVQVLLEAQSTAQAIAISVVIPTYNRVHLVENAVRSVCEQPGGPFEVILVDDAGQDIPTDVLNRLAELPIPVQVLKHTENHGLGAARNTGAQRARGEWLMVLDDDDILVPGGPHLLLERAQQTKASFVCGDHIRRYFQNETRVARGVSSAASRILRTLGT